jgi:uncharacterized phiE125 gp8 family phage protein
MAGLKLITPSKSEPLNLLEDVKPYLRIDAGDTSNDQFIQLLITSAREAAELKTARGLCTQTWRQYFDHFPGCDLTDRFLFGRRREFESHRHHERHHELMRSPLNDETFVLKYLDPDEAEQTVAPSVYVLDAASDPANFRLAAGASWPAVACVPNAVWAEFAVGYGDNGENLPATYKVAMLYLINHWYENRDATQEGALLEIPMAFTSLLNLNKVRYA